MVVSCTGAKVAAVRRVQHTVRICLTALLLGLVLADIALLRDTTRGSFRLVIFLQVALVSPASARLQQ